MFQDSSLMMLSFLYVLSVLSENWLNRELVRAHWTPLFLPSFYLHHGYS